MNLKKRKLLCAVLSATTVMSMLTSVTAVATNSNDDNTNAITTENTVQAKALTGNQLATAPQIDNVTDTENYGATGDLSFEYGVPEDATIIESVSDYYKLTGKKIRYQVEVALKRIYQVV